MLKRANIVNDLQKSRRLPVFCTFSKSLSIVDFVEKYNLNVTDTRMIVLCE